MAVSGLLALLDDVSSMLDDPSNLEQLAAEKTAKIAEDGITQDLAKNKKMDARHEMSVVLAVAKGALKNKLLYFIPSTFAIAVFAPWAVIPLAIGSGAFIAYEGVKKFADKRDPAAAEKHRAALRAAHAGGEKTLLRYEQERIAQAIKTDAALSLELAGFQLGMTAGAPILTKLAVVGVTSVGATMLLYTTIIGVIGMNGVARRLAAAPGKSWTGRSQRAVGRQLMRLSSPVMKTIAAVGMAALFYVGGHLLAAFVPGAESALGALAGAVTGTPLAAAAIETAATLATGVAAEIATFGGVRLLTEPAKRIKISAQWLWEEKLRPPLNSLRAAMTRRSGAAPTADLPGNEFPAPEAPTIGPAPTEFPPSPTVTAAKPDPAACLPPPGAVARSFTWAAAPGMPPAPEVSDLPAATRPETTPVRPPQP